MKQVVIVGGGVVGLFCAVRLAKAGARVTVLEAEYEDVGVFGPAASSAAAGMLAPFDRALEKHEAAALASFDLWKQMREGAEWADGVRFDGAVVVGRDTLDAELLVVNAKRLGRGASLLSPQQVRKRTGFTANIEDAAFIADEGVADPLRVLSGLAMQARAHGVIIEYGADVANVTANAALTYDGAMYEGDEIVLCPGAWAREELIRAAPALGLVQPGKGVMTAVALAQSLGPNFRTPGFYLAQRRDDVVLGATMEMGRYDRFAEPARVAELLAAAEALLPGVAKPAERAWGGIRPMSPDGWPMIGRSGQMLVAAGHSRDGWLLAPITAEIITAYVYGAHVPPEWAAFSPQRFKPT